MSFPVFFMPHDLYTSSGSVDRVTKKWPPEIQEAWYIISIRFSNLLLQLSNFLKLSSYLLHPELFYAF